MTKTWAEAVHHLLPDDGWAEAVQPLTDPNWAEATAGLLEDVTVPEALANRVRRAAGAPYQGIAYVNGEKFTYTGRPPAALQRRLHAHTQALRTDPRPRGATINGQSIALLTSVPAIRRIADNITRKEVA